MVWVRAHRLEATVWLFLGVLAMSKACEAIT